MFFKESYFIPFTLFAILYQVANSIIRIWLWARYRAMFESALANHTSIDNNQECQWILNMAADFSVNAMIVTSNEIESTVGSKMSSGETSTAAQLVRLAFQISERLSQGFYVDPFVVSPFAA